MKESPLKVIHETMKDLHQAGVIGKVTMRKFDTLCLSPVVPLSPKEIKSLREQVNLSQPVFAEALNVSSSTVKHWEIGDKFPSGAALKLLNIVKRNGLAGLA
jgi:putative transcriptional regulator